MGLENVATNDKWCVHCGLRVKLISRDDEEAIGRGELPLYIHDARKMVSDPMVCSRSNLKEEDVVANDWWEGKL
jgi:hypothetical protein